MSLNIAVIGAAGRAGRRVVAEARRRGHEVTAVVRNARQFQDFDVRVHVADARRSADVMRIVTGTDVVVSATRPAAGHEDDLSTVALNLLTRLNGSGIRLLVVGGAASLIVPDSGGRRVIDDPRFAPPGAREIAMACIRQLNTCRSSTGTQWSYLSPPATLHPGKRTGRYRLGTDELLVDDNGDSKISIEDLAVALIDEVERPRHHNMRFTVAY